jgi:hypothetical protein
VNADGGDVARETFEVFLVLGVQGIGYEVAADLARVGGSSPIGRSTTHRLPPA